MILFKLDISEMSFNVKTFDPGQLFGQLIRSKYIWLLNSLLAVLLMVLAGKLIFLLVFKPDVPEIHIKQAKGFPQTPYALFPSNTGTIGGLPEATIDAQVLGLVSSGDQSIATIAIKGGDQSVYRVGDEITNSVTVEAIDRSGVVVREQGVLRRISIKRLNADSEVSLVDSGTAPAIDGVSIENLLDNIDLVSEVDDGTPGLRVRHVAEPFAHEFDIYSGDFITLIDSLPVLSSLEGMAPRDFITNLFAREQVVTIDLLRDGEQRQIQIDKTRFEQFPKP